MANTDYSGLLDLAGSQYKWSAWTGGASAFAQLAGAGLNYQALQTNAAALQVQASQIELQAKERANQLREQFVSAIGSYQFSAANRGVSVGSGSVRSNIESSAKNLGNDLMRQERSAQLQASALRSQAKVAKLQSKSALVGGILGGISSAAGAFGSWAMGDKLQALAHPTLANGGKIAPVPGPKPKF